MNLVPKGKLLWLTYSYRNRSCIHFSLNFKFVYFKNNLSYFSFEPYIYWLLVRYCSRLLNGSVKQGFQFANYGFNLWFSTSNKGLKYWQFFDNFPAFYYQPEAFHQKPFVFIGFFLTRTVELCVDSNTTRNVTCKIVNSFKFCEKN